MDNIGFASKEFWDYQHQNHLEPKSVVLYDPYDLMLVRKLLLNSIIFDFDYTFLGSLLDDYVEESNWVLVVIPHCFEVVFDDNCDAAHDRYDKHKEICEVCLTIYLWLGTVGSSVIECHLPLNN